MKKAIFRRIFKVIGVVVACLTIGSTLPGISLGQDAQAAGGMPAAVIPVPFFDDVENPAANNWVADSPWSRTTAASHSGTTSWTDSDGGYYGNNVDLSLTIASPLDLSGATNPQLKFWHRYQLEAGFDYARVQISTDGGTNWTTLVSYSGTQTSPYKATIAAAPAEGPRKAEVTEGPLLASTEPWAMEQLDLSAYAGQTNVKIRFRLQTDDSVVRDGWYVDDISVAGLPTAVTLSPISTPTRTSLSLSWSQNADADFAKYDVYRSLTAEVSYRNTLVTSITDSATTTFTDTGLVSKTTYYYKVYVVSSHEIYSGSNEQSGTTLAGLNYPFFDNMEAGPSNWVAQPSTVWTLVTPDSAHSGTKAWTDSPTGNYENNTDASLTLGDDIEINPASQLTFWHRLAIAAGDNALVEISTDAGSTWTTIDTFTNQQINTWTRVQLDLGDATAAARIRFRLVTDASGTAGGWDIDDVGISDLPTPVTLDAPVPQGPPNESKMQLTWSQNTDTFFQSYQVYRKTAAGVSTLDTLVATITNQGTTSYMDTGLAATTKYYYKVYVMNPHQATSGSNEQSATTFAPGGVVGYPFSDDMESGRGNWDPQTPWGLTEEAAHGGTKAWTDSPASDYANNANTSLKISINLGSAMMPVLSFWHKYSLQENADFGFIEVSIDSGTTWSRIYFVTGGSASWLNEKVDISEYAGQARLMIRFRLSSNASGTADGWYIDDVSINETTATIGYPFYDDMESGTGNWLAGSWKLTTPGHSPNNALTDSPLGNYLLDAWEEFDLAGVIDLSSAVNPRLTFWHKYWFYDYASYPINEHDYGRVYVSNYYGRGGTWEQVAAFTGTQSQWTRVQIDLSKWVGLSSVRIKFVVDDNRDTNPDYGADNHQADGWYIDDVRIEDAPRDVTLNPPTNVTMHSADLSWTENAEADFARYEIYRSKSATVDRSGTLVASIDSQATTTFTDTYTILQPDSYYYRVYVVDQLEMFSPGSNTVVATYTVPQVGYPFSDDMEGGTNNWEWGAPWGLTDSFAHSATHSWTDSPLGSYADNTDTSLTTYVSLASASSPVLTFWHKSSLEQNKDYGYVEVSTNGGATWTRLLSVTGVEDWNQERINLSAYHGSVIGLRFRLVSDASGTGDGWYIDDVNIAEGAIIASYPFSDNMESGLGSWLYSSPWGQTTELYHGGTVSWTDSPFGDYANSTDTSLWLTLDLSAAVMPVLDFWHRYSLQENADFGFIEVSVNGGTTWNRRYFVTGSSDWVNDKLDLTEFAGQAGVMIRFRLVSDASTTSDGWYIDDVAINETATATIQYPFFDNMDGETANWLSGAWELVTGGLSSPNYWTDSPRGNYLLDNWTELVLSNAIDLSSAVKPQLTFWHKYWLYNYNAYPVTEYDYGRVYVSNYNGKGGTWEQVAAFTGTQGEWTMVQIDLSKFAGVGTVRLKFVLDDNRDTNTAYGEDNHQADGWYIDDIRIQDAPTDVVVSEPANVTMHGADLSWTENADANFARYEIYRSKTTPVTRSSTLVATITDKTNTAFTDVYTILQPDRYSYRMWVVDQLGRYSLGSNEVTAVYTVPSVTYPFYDNMEGGTANWEWSAPWGQTNAFFQSGSTSWADSPVGTYADNASTALTTSISLANAGSPILTFWHKFNLEQGKDFGYVEISTNNGSTWTTVFSATGTEGWNWEKVNLSAYIGQTIVLRFRLASDASGRADGWYIDDVRIEDGAVSTGYPFSDDMESGLGVWFYSSPWGQTTELAYSGSTSWTDSPYGDYGNNTDTSLRLTLNLASAVMPVLDFWQRYSLEKNADFAFIEVSTNGGSSWDRIYFVTGNQASWVNKKVDLTRYAGQAEVMIRFRLVTNSSGTTDGWYIDDVSIHETAAPVTSYPFFDNMEGGTGNWLPGAWELVTPGYSPTRAWTDSSQGNYILDNWMELTLSNVIDLRSAVHPVLTFWHKYWLYNYNSYPVTEYDYGRVYVSNYYGQGTSWEQVAYFTGTQGEWTRVQVDLSNYAGLGTVRLKFVLDDNRDTNTAYGEDNHQADGWYIDDIRIGEKDETAPAAVGNLVVSGFTPSSVVLNWMAPGDDGNTGAAAQYDIRHSTSLITEANWNAATQLTGEPTPQPAGFNEGFTVPGLIPTTTYYFALKAADEDLNWSVLSNIASGTTLGTGEVTVTVDTPTNVLAARDFTARIESSEVQNLDAANYDIVFDPAVLQLTNVTPGQIGSTQVPVGSWNETTSGTVSVVQNVEGTPGVSGSGYLAVLHFHVLGTASSTSDITLANGTLSDNEANAIGARWVGDSVHVTDVLPGDANGDEAVNALDITKIERIIVGLDTATPGADANNDGAVNAMDITLTERIIVGLE